MTTHFRTLEPSEPLQVAAHELLASSQQDFPVTEGERVIGVLTRGDLVRALQAEGPETRIGDVMRPASAVLSDTDQLDKSYDLLKEDGQASIPVVHEGRLVGMIGLENILDWMAVHGALTRSWRNRRHAPA
jgi:CBS domain-containing protein